ncbi:NepR family anti-sigma factor [Microvirga ossetica]|nr:NepR family anti-sigma factor [Microvirga ossetica]
MSRAIQDEIGERLRVMYDDLKDEPVPDHLLALLKQLDKSWSDESS